MVGLYPQRGEQLVHGQPGDTERRLSDSSVGQRCTLPRRLFLAERGRREHRTGPPVAEFQESAQPRERHEQLRQHAGALTALPGKEESDLACAVLAQRVTVGCEEDAIPRGG